MTNTLETPNASNDKLSRSSKIVLAIVLLSYVMGVLDVSIVITALPKMLQEFHASPSEMSWVQSTFTLAYGGLLLLGARAGDILGRKRMYLIGLGLFTATSVLIGLAQSLPLLLAARALQGMGAAILGPTTLAILTTHFAEGPQRTRAVSYYGAAAGIGGSLGLVLGGFMADLLSWRFGFFMNLPLGIGLAIAAVKHLKETEGNPGHFDVIGAITSTLGMTSIVYGIVSSSLMFGAIGAVLIALFVYIEHRATQPIMPLRLFSNRERVGAYSTRMMFLGGMMGFWFFMSQFLQGALGFSAIQAAVAFLPTTISTFVTAMMVPKLSKRFGSGRLIAAGLTITTIGMFWISRSLSVNVPYFTGIVLPMVLLGLGQGCCIGPITGSGIAGVKPEDAGAAGGLVNVSQQIGGSIGLAVLVALFSATNPGGLGEKALLTHRISVVFTGCSIMLATALVLALTLIVKSQASAVRVKAQAILETA